MREFILTTFASASDIDWPRFLVAISFGYSLSIIPLVVIGVSYFQSGETGIFKNILLQKEIFLILAVISFSSIGSLLSNADRIDFIVLIGSASNVLFGVTMMLVYSVYNLEAILRNRLDDQVVGYTELAIALSFVIFAVSHLRRKNS